MDKSGKYLDRIEKNDNILTNSGYGGICMGFFIGIEDLAANALIEVLSAGERRFLTYSEIETYGNKVVEILGEDGDHAVLILSRDNTSAMFRNYSDFCDERVKDGKRGIYLREGKNVIDLIDNFRGYLPLNVLLAFIDPRSRSVLGVAS